MASEYTAASASWGVSPESTLRFDGFLAARLSAGRSERVRPTRSPAMKHSAAISAEYARNVGAYPPANVSENRSKSMGPSAPTSAPNVSAMSAPSWVPSRRLYSGND